MRFVYVRLKGYIGIYNGLGLGEIQIDFSKAVNGITLISGINGCGKSTLLKALSVFPDNSSDYMNGYSAEKELHIMHQDILYTILITSPFNNSGRSVTKASIKKNGVELNPNGNITSYKEVVESEFELDSSFEVLTYLSSENRGLADKTPAERKKFMNSRIASVEVYNQIYKNLSKKSLIFRSHINNLHNKIQGIGDEGSLRTSLSSLQASSSRIQDTEIKLRDGISRCQSDIESGGLDQETQKWFETAKDSLDGLKAEISKLHLDLINTLPKIDFPPLIDGQDPMILRTAISDRYQGVLSEIDKIKFKIDEKRNRSLSLGNEIGKIDNDIELKRIQQKEYSDDKHSVESIQRLIDEENETLDTAASYLVNRGYKYDVITSNDLNTLYRQITVLIDMIDEFYDGSAVSNFLSDAIKNNIDISVLVGKRDACRKKIDEITEMKKTDEKDLIVLEHDLAIITDAETNRPSKCKIDNCPYLVEAISTKGKYPGDTLRAKIGSIQTNIETLDKMITQTENSLIEIEYAIEKFRIYTKIVPEYKFVVELIQKLMDSPPNIGHIESITNGYHFTALRNFVSVNISDDTAAINQYVVARQHIAELKNRKELRKRSTAILNILIEEEKELERTKDSLQDDRDKCNRTISELEVELEKLQSSDTYFRNILEWLNILGQKNTEYKDISDRYDNIITRSKAALEALDYQNALKEQLVGVLQEKTTTENQIAIVQNKLTMLEQYKLDFQKFSNKNDMVELIKKYTSPTQSGIQNIFIQTYMSKTLDLANQILGMIFNGEYRLLDFVVNDKEFRIPFIGSGMAVDDVSSGSSSQVCIIGMAISMALKYQASTKYNITRFDEIDSGLDSKNRLDLINIIHHIKAVLGIEQVIMISHSAEIEMGNVDVIQLRRYENMDVGCNGNIIYDFDSMIKQSDKIEE